MRRFSNPLDNVTVAAPCPADWDAMIGDERIRFCGQCELNVYNLSGMSRRDAEALVTRTEGRLCIRYYRRKDGSILTDDCPVGLRRLRSRALKVRRAIGAALLGFLAGVGIHGMLEQIGTFLVSNPISFGHTTGVMAEPPRQPDTGKLVLIQPRSTGRSRANAPNPRTK